MLLKIMHQGTPVIRFPVSELAGFNFSHIVDGKALKNSHCNTGQSCVNFRGMHRFQHFSLTFSFL